MTLPVVGLDVGSLTTKAVVMDVSGHILGRGLVGSSPRPEETGRRVLEQALAEAGFSPGDPLRVVATGYGRVALPFAEETVTEITCHAKGASFLHPGTKLVVDVGGQDSKAIRLNEEGRVLDFAMNDKCSAGTGRFLNAMAETLQTGLDGLGPAGLKSRKDLVMSSTCTVFAESEVISLIAGEESVEDIAHAVHAAMAKRLAGLVRMVGPAEPALFTGGGALNTDLVRCLQSLLGLSFTVPERPRYVGAVGAARLGIEAVRPTG